MSILTNKKIIRRVINKYYYYFNNIYVEIEKQLLYNKIKKNKIKKNIYLFSNPIHSNLGDQAQTYCILKWFNKYYPDYNVICAPQRNTTEKTFRLIYQKLAEKDLIFVHSGYLIFDPHPELSYICKVVKLFNDRRIVILPQTVNLISESMILKVSKIFNSHTNLVLLCRDNISYSNAQKLFPKCKLLLWPDFVTSLIGLKEYNDRRDGILFCLRNDGEKFYSDYELYLLKLKIRNTKIMTTDTTISKSAFAWKFNREKLIENVINDFSRYQLVITDRYHGTIFSQITSTPVIVLSSSDHKLSSGVKWFPKDFFSFNVFFANNLEEAYDIAMSILGRGGKVCHNPPYFRDVFFSNLKDKLEQL